MLSARKIKVNSVCTCVCVFVCLCVSVCVCVCVDLPTLVFQMEHVVPYLDRKSRSKREIGRGGHIERPR